MKGIQHRFKFSNSGLLLWLKIEDRTVLADVSQAFQAGEGLRLPSDLLEIEVGTRLTIRIESIAGLHVFIEGLAAASESGFVRFEVDPESEKNAAEWVELDDWFRPPGTAAPESKPPAESAAVVEEVSEPPESEPQAAPASPEPPKKKGLEHRFVEHEGDDLELIVTFSEDVLKNLDRQLQLGKVLRLPRHSEIVEGSALLLRVEVAAETRALFHGEIVYCKGKFMGLRLDRALSDEEVAAESLEPEVVDEAPVLLQEPVEAPTEQRKAKESSDEDVGDNDSVPSATPEQTATPSKVPLKGIEHSFVERDGVLFLGVTVPYGESLEHLSRLLKSNKVIRLPRRSGTKTGASLPIQITVEDGPSVEFEGKIFYRKKDTMGVGIDPDAENSDAQWDTLLTWEPPLEVHEDEVTLIQEAKAFRLILDVTRLDALNACIHNLKKVGLVILPLGNNASFDDVIIFQVSHPMFAQGKPSTWHHGKKVPPPSEKLLFTARRATFDGLRAVVPEQAALKILRDARDAIVHGEAMPEGEVPPKPANTPPARSPVKGIQHRFETQEQGLVLMLTLAQRESLEQLSRLLQANKVIRLPAHPDLSKGSPLTICIAVKGGTTGSFEGRVFYHKKGFVGIGLDLNAEPAPERWAELLNEGADPEVFEAPKSASQDDVVDVASPAPEVKSKPQVEAPVVDDIFELVGKSGSIVASEVSASNDGAQTLVTLDAARLETLAICLNDLQRTGMLVMPLPGTVAAEEDSTFQVSHRSIGIKPLFSARKVGHDGLKAASYKEAVEALKSVWKEIAMASKS